MENSQRIEIPLSKKKLVLSMLGCIVFIAVGGWFFVNPSSVRVENLIVRQILRNPTAIALIGMIAILFFGWIMIVCIAKFRDKTPGLVITKDGFTDNSSGVSAGDVLWTDVMEIKEINESNQKFLMFVVKNPEMYIDRQQSLFNKKAMQANHKIFGSPVFISSNALACDFNKLKNLMENQFKNFRNS